MSVFAGQGENGQENTYVVPTNVTIPLNVTAPDKCHSSPRHMSRPTTILSRQMSQPQTNVTTALSKCHSQPQMSHHCLDNVTANDKCDNFASTNVTANDKCHNITMISTTNDTTSRQMSVVISFGQSLFHRSVVEYFTWPETHNIFIFKK